MAPAVLRDCLVISWCRNLRSVISFAAGGGGLDSAHARCQRGAMPCATCCCAQATELCDAAEAAFPLRAVLPPHTCAWAADAARCLAVCRPCLGLSVDDLTRQVCFSRHGAPHLPFRQPARHRHACRTPTGPGGDAAMTFPRRHPSAIPRTRVGSRSPRPSGCCSSVPPWHYQQRRPVAARRTDPEQRTGCRSTRWACAWPISNNRPMRTSAGRRRSARPNSPPRGRRWTNG